MQDCNLGGFWVNGRVKRRGMWKKRGGKRRSQKNPQTRLINEKERTSPQNPTPGKGLGTLPTENRHQKPKAGPRIKVWGGKDKDVKKHNPGKGNTKNTSVASEGYCWGGGRLNSKETKKEMSMSRAKQAKELEKKRMQGCGELDRKEPRQ